VIFDVGHGRGSFSFATARGALAQDLAPGSISSDLHIYNVAGPVFDLATTMSKFLALGVPLSEVVRMTTAAPARAIGADTIGTLRPGADADVTLLRIESGSFTLTDSHGESLVAGERFVPVHVVRNGIVRPATLATGRPP
jgi:dihydroorotase